MSDHDMVEPAESLAQSHLEDTRGGENSTDWKCVDETSRPQTASVTMDKIQRVKKPRRV